MGPNTDVEMIIVTPIMYEVLSTITQSEGSICFCDLRHPIFYVGLPSLQP